MEGRGIGHKLSALIAACLAGGAATLALATPAYAEDADLRLEIRSGQLDLKTDGDPQVLRLAVINDGPSPVSSAVANVQAPLGGRGVTIGNTSHSCSAVNGPMVIACQLGAMNPGQTIDVTVELKPPGEGAVQPGENVNENGNAWVSNPAGGDPNNGNDGGQFTAVLTAGQQGGEVNEVSGQVVDGSSGEPLEGATVEVKDSTGRAGTTTTDGEGRFTYRAEPPLQAGRITVKATKAGYETTRTTVDTEGGSVNDVQLAVSKAEAVPSPTPSVVPSSAAATQAPAAAGADDDDSSSLLVVILVSVIATAILAGAALWIGLRRNRDNEPAYAGDGGFQPPMRPVNIDAPTVQLRMPGPGGGTRVMPTLGSPESDATQQIPLPDNTQLTPPGPHVAPIAYDQTAPFGPPPTTAFEPPAGRPDATALFSPSANAAPDPTAMFSPSANAAPDPTAMFHPPATGPVSSPPARPFSSPPAGPISPPPAGAFSPPAAGPFSPPGAEPPFVPPGAETTAPFSPAPEPGAPFTPASYSPTSGGPFSPPAAEPTAPVSPPGAAPFPPPGAAPFPPPAPAPDLFAPLPDLPRRDATPRHEIPPAPSGPQHRSPEPPLQETPLARPFVPPHNADRSSGPRHADPRPSQDIPPVNPPAPPAAETTQDPAARYRGPLDPTPPNSTVLRFTQNSQPVPETSGPSPLSTQDGARPPITALQAPLTTGSVPRLGEAKDDDERR